MALNVGPGPVAHWSHHARVRAGDVAVCDQDELLDEILQLRDAVLAGNHPHLKLPATTLEQLRTALGRAPLPPISSSVATPAARPSLDPIFLEKSDSLVRAEGRLKRQRIERELQNQVDQRRHALRDKDSAGDGLVRLDLGSILRDALQRVPHVSGIAPVVRTEHEKSASFDTNDYYSSRAPSAWSEEVGASRSPSLAAAHDAPLQSQNVWSSEYPSHGNEHGVTNVTLPAKPHLLTDVTNGNDDDDYIPPDAEAFDSFHDGDDQYMAQPADIEDDDDDSEYDPGDVTQDSFVLTPQHDDGSGKQQTNATAINFPVIRNHLAHIVAPQPNRVSPLTTVQGGPEAQLQLVNGRPELVSTGHDVVRRSSLQAISRGSTATPTTTPDARSLKRKRRIDKRKREKELLRKVKKRKERPNDAYSPSSPARGAPGVKKEPVSPPPFGVLQPAAQFTRPVSQVDAPPRGYVAQPPSHPAPLNAEHGYASASFGQPAPVSRLVQRHSSDLRRVATLHQAQQTSAQATQLLPAPSAPSTPTRSWQYTPSQPLLVEPSQPHRRDTTIAAELVQPVQAPRTYTQPPVDYVVDQYGTRYYATDAAPPQATHAPPEYRPSSDFAYERAASRMLGPTPVQHVPYVDSSMRYVEYVDSHVDRFDDQSTSRAQAPFYSGSYRSSTMQPLHARDGTAVPPPAPAPPTLVPYDPNYPAPAQPHGYYTDARDVAVPAYVRQASAAPVRYIRQEAPVVGRASQGSLMPPAGVVSHDSAYAQPPVRFVDQYGREVYPQEVRQVSEYRY